ncbi:MAG: ATPase, partial [Candidatus Omnitrophica bacterium CG11_big_fil_rev_8_21_14_0_20_63_9]
MYLEFLGLREKPFSITADPSFLYLSKKHQEALS